MSGRRSSLRRQLLLGLLPALLLLFVASGTGAYLLIVHYTDGVYDSWLVDSAHSLALVVSDGPDGLALDLPESSRQLFVWDSVDTTYYQVSDGKGRFVAGTAALPAPPPSARDTGDAKLFATQIDGVRVHAASIEVPVGVDQRTVRVTVADTGRKRDQLERRILLAVLVPEGLLILIVAAVIRFGVRRGLAPLQTLATQIDRHEHDRSLLPLSVADVPAEVLPLTEALNNLLSRLGESMALQRNFITDAAHQLRTPLAALKLLIEQLAAEQEPAERRRLTIELAVSNDRAIRLANQLLSLARAEPGALDVAAFGPVDLVALAREIGAEWVPRALRRNLELGFDGVEAPVRVHGSAALLGEALNNLIDNALKYHPGNGTVSLAVIDGPEPALVVEDDGPGIPPADRPKVRLRFQRVDRPQPPGAGLGLAIVEGIVLAHHARFELLDGRGGRGTRAVIRFSGPAPTADAKRGRTTI